MMIFRFWLFLFLSLVFRPLVYAEAETIQPGVVEDQIGPVIMTTTGETTKSTDTTEAAKKKLPSGDTLQPSSHAQAQDGCLGICKKYQEICAADSIYNEKDCREQWNACETGCLQL